MFYKSTQTHLQSLYGGILIPQTLKYEISPIQAEYSVICTNFNEELRHTGTKDKSLTKQNLKTSTPGTCLRTPWGTCTVSLLGNYLVRLLSFILAMQNCWIVFFFVYFFWVIWLQFVRSLSFIYEEHWACIWLLLRPVYIKTENYKDNKKVTEYC